jgi:hypothetical protein
LVTALRAKIEAGKMTKMAPNVQTYWDPLAFGFCLRSMEQVRCPRWRPIQYLDMIVNDLAFGVCLRSMEAVAIPKIAPTTLT